MKVTLASSVCIAALAASSFAGDIDAGKIVIENPCSFYVQAVGGASFFVAGDLLETFDSEIGHVGDLSFDDVYGNASTYGLRAGRACDWGRMYVGFEYTEASAGDSLQLGTYVYDHGLSQKDVFGKFSDYSDYALLLGVERDLFRAAGGGKNPVRVNRFRPWVGAQIGIRFVDGIDATVTDAYGYDVGMLTADSPHAIFDDSVVFTAAFTCGVAFDLNDRISIGVESGVRYQTALDDVDDGLSILGFDGGNDDADLLAIPVLGTVAIKF